MIKAVKKLLLYCLLLTALLPGMPAMADDELIERLRHRLETLNEPGQLVAGEQILYAGQPLQRLYERRGWQPIWFDEKALPLALLDDAIDAIDLAFEHGLDPELYHRAALAEALEWLGASANGDRDRDRDRRILVDVELLASDALMTLGHHLAYGRIDPQTIDPGWMIEREPPELLARLVGAAPDGQINLRRVLETLLPRHAEYGALVQRLALQRAIAADADWQLLHSGPTMRPGDLDPRLSEIRRRLAMLGDLPVDLQDTVEHDGRYDTELEPAVIAFQRRHGLDADGIIGARTLAALNFAPEARIDQLRANLERWRWLPASLGEEYILVNIAGFDMRVVSGGQAVMSQRVVVGQPYRHTPVFTGRMSYLVLNPSWEVPHKLATQDQLPKIRADLAYLDEMGFSILQGWGASEVRIDPHDIEWSSLSRRNFPYRLRQAPGPNNALGQVKFMFPNRHNVYLHDSPARGLFAQEDRARSSGCIRLEDPHRLTEWLLIERGGLMNAERIRRILDSGTETTIRLDRPIAVHLLYWTAWVDEFGLPPRK